MAASLLPALRGRRPWLAVIATAAGLAAALAYGEWRLAQTFADGPAIGVAVVQAGAPPGDPAERPARLARTLDLTRGVASPQASWIVWPEHAIDGYLEEASSERDAVLAVARESRADLLLGGPHFAPAPGGSRPRYTPGDGALTLAASALRVGVSICFEAMFPDAAREAVGEGADLLVNLSNDSWFGDADAARPRLDIARLRAVEKRRPLVRAAATGFSDVIGAHGRTVAQSGFGAHVHTPHQRFGDSFLGIAIAAVVAATLRAAFRRIAAPQA